MGYLHKELLPNVSFASLDAAQTWITDNRPDAGYEYLPVACWLGMPLASRQQLPDSYRIRRKKLV